MRGVVEKRKLTYLEQVGESTMRRSIVKFEELGNATLTFFEGLFPPYFFDWENFARQLAAWGFDSLPIAVISASVGAMIMSHLLAININEQGIGQLGLTLIGGAVATVMTQNLGPILIGLILAGRVGAAITSELGSMKISEQVDALKALGVDPFQYLIFPRLLASFLMTPMVVTAAILLAVYVAYYPAHQESHLTWPMYMDSIRDWMRMRHVWEMIEKAAIYGVIIVLVCSYKGLAVREGAVDLGDKVTEAVVTSMVCILLADLLLTRFYFR
ncbi:MAG: MlaE family ABC transporter permease [bacterium]